MTKSFAEYASEALDKAEEFLNSGRLMETVPALVSAHFNIHLSPKGEQEKLRKRYEELSERTKPHSDSYLLHRTYHNQIARSLAAYEGMTEYAQELGQRILEDLEEINRRREVQSQ
jgi:acetylornithine deacetylase/succinyl-diaminopimelate desuccinylase-like protein